MPKKQAARRAPSKAKGAAKTKDKALSVDEVMKHVRGLTKIAKGASATKKKPTLQSLGLLNVKREVADMTPKQVARQVANMIVDVARSILSGKGRPERRSAPPPPRPRALTRAWRRFQLHGPEPVVEQFDVRRGPRSYRAQRSGCRAPPRPLASSLTPAVASQTRRRNGCSATL